MLNMEIGQSPSQDAQRVIGKVSALAMADEDFKGQLKEDPTAILGAHGLAMPDGMRVEILEAFEDIPDDRDPDTLYLVVPDAAELTEEELGILNASKSCQSTASTAFCIPSCVSCASTASTQSCT
jgi:hypothetical protein